jgi:hypothetical protein
LLLLLLLHVLKHAAATTCASAAGAVVVTTVANKIHHYLLSSFTRSTLQENATYQNRHDLLQTLQREMKPTTLEEQCGQFDASAFPVDEAFLEGLPSSQARKWWCGGRDVFVSSVLYCISSARARSSFFWLQFAFCLLSVYFCFPFAFCFRLLSLSVCFPFAFRLLLLLLSFCFPFAFRLLSVCFCFPFAFLLLSSCFPFAFRLLSFCLLFVCFPFAFRLFGISYPSLALLTNFTPFPFLF